MTRTIAILILGVALAATALRAAWNSFFVTNHPHSHTDCSTIEESRQIGAFIQELHPDQPSIAVSGQTFTFHEVWMEHPTLLTYPLVWWPRWKHEPGFTVSVRFMNPPFPHRDFWVECDGSLYGYFDENDRDRFNIRFDTPPKDPIVLKIRDFHSKATLATVHLNTKQRPQQDPTEH